MNAADLSAAARHIRKQVSLQAKSIDKAAQQFDFDHQRFPYPDKIGPFYSGWLKVKADKPSGALLLLCSRQIGTSVHSWDDVVMPAVQALARQMEAVIAADLGLCISVEAQENRADIGTVTAVGEPFSIGLRAEEVG